MTLTFDPRLPKSNRFIFGSYFIFVENVLKFPPCALEISVMGRMYRQTDGQRKNIMPKGRGIKICICWYVSRNFYSKVSSRNLKWRGAS